MGARTEKSQQRETGLACVSLTGVPEFVGKKEKIKLVNTKAAQKHSGVPQKTQGFVILGHLPCRLD